MNKLLTLAAVAEGATGLALLIAPSLVGRLLLGAELAGASIPVARVTGIALIALGVSCLPHSVWAGLSHALIGMLTYSLLVTVYLLYLGVRGEWVGSLLWPAVALHAALTMLFVMRLFQGAAKQASGTISGGRAGASRSLGSDRARVKEPRI